jgi:hypothetical protein
MIFNKTNCLHQGTKLMNYFGFRVRTRKNNFEINTKTFSMYNTEIRIELFSICGRVKN